MFATSPPAVLLPLRRELRLHLSSLLRFSTQGPFTPDPLIHANK
jgi:hypothetical protein